MSNLPYISKFLERVVTAQLNDNQLLDKLQSAYRAGFSTETVLLQVMNDITVCYCNDLSSKMASKDVLAERCQRVKVNVEVSAYTELDCDVPNLDPSNCSPSTVHSWDRS